MKGSTLSKLHKMEDVLNDAFVERQEEIHGLTLATISGANILLLGPPGTAKSNMVTAFQQLVTGTSRLEKLLTKTTTPEEIFGPYSLSALEQDKYERKIEGYLPTVDFAFIDETFKSSSTLLNSLLQVMNERTFTQGHEVKTIPLLTLIGASNEIPEESDGLAALFDRFHLKYMVHPIKERLNRIKMLSSKTTGFSPIISLDEIKEAKDAIESIKVSSDMYEKYTELMDKLNAVHMTATDRSYKTSIKIMRAEAYFNGRTEINEEDFEILRHILWTKPEDSKKLYSYILEIVNPDKNKVFEILNLAQEAYDKPAVHKTEAEKTTQAGQSAAELKKCQKDLMVLLNRAKELKKNTKTIQNAIDSVDKLIENFYNVYFDFKIDSHKI